MFSFCESDSGSVDLTKPIPLCKKEELKEKYKQSSLNQGQEKIQILIQKNNEQSSSEEELDLSEYENSKFKDSSSYESEEEKKNDEKVNVIKENKDIKKGPIESKEEEKKRLGELQKRKNKQRVKEEWKEAQKTYNVFLKWVCEYWDKIVICKRIYQELGKHLFIQLKSLLKNCDILLKFFEEYTEECRNYPKTAKTNKNLQNLINHYSEISETQSNQLECFKNYDEDMDKAFKEFSQIVKIKIIANLQKTKEILSSFIKEKGSEIEKYVSYAQKLEDNCQKSFNHFQDLYKSTEPKIGEIETVDVGLWINQNGFYKSVKEFKAALKTLFANTSDVWEKGKTLHCNTIRVQKAIINKFISEKNSRFVPDAFIEEMCEINPEKISEEVFDNISIYQNDIQVLLKKYDASDHPENSKFANNIVRDLNLPQFFICLKNLLFCISDLPEFNFINRSGEFQRQNGILFDNWTTSYVELSKKNYLWIYNYKHDVEPIESINLSSTTAQIFEDKDGDKGLSLIEKRNGLLIKTFNVLLKWPRDRNLKAWLDDLSYAQ